MTDYSEPTESTPESLYRGVCALAPGQSCWYSSTAHEWTKKPVTVEGPIEIYEDHTIVPVRGPQQDQAGYYFKANHTEGKVYQRHENSEWNELKALRVDF